MKQPAIIDFELHSSAATYAATLLRPAWLRDTTGAPPHNRGPSVRSTRWLSRSDELQLLDRLQARGNTGETITGATLRAELAACSGKKPSVSGVCQFLARHGWTRYPVPGQVKSRLRDDQACAA